MAIFHVIYDPTDRVQIERPNHLPSGVHFVSMKCDDPVENADVAELARKLATLLLEQL